MFTFLHITYLTLSLFISGSLAVSAAEFTPLVGIPNVDTDTTSLVEYINAVYLTLIGLGALFGVLKIAFAGVKYSLSDIITDKNSAKEDIKGVLLGLLILISPYVVLSTIYAGLTDISVLDAIERRSSLGPSAGDQSRTASVPPTAEEGTQVSRCTRTRAECEALCRGTLRSVGEAYDCVSEARDEERYPRAGTITQIIYRDVTESEYTRYSEAQREELRQSCRERQGQLTDLLGCTVEIRLECPPEAYFNRVDGNCARLPNN